MRNLKNIIVMGFILRGSWVNKAITIACQKSATSAFLADEAKR